MWGRLDLLLAMARQPVHSLGRKSFASINTLYSTGFSSFNRARIASAKLLGDGGLGRRRNASIVFSSSSSFAQLFCARETHPTSMAASDILKCGAFDLLTRWTEIRRELFLSH